MEIGCRSGPCRTCRNSGSCMAGHGDDEYCYAPPEIVEANNERARQHREEMSAGREATTKRAYPDHFRDSWDDVKRKQDTLKADYPDAILEYRGGAGSNTVYTVFSRGNVVAEQTIFSATVIVHNAAPISKMLDDFRAALEAYTATSESEE